jgi:hypothetical protein
MLYGWFWKLKTGNKTEKIGIVVAYNLPTGQKYGNRCFFAKLETEVQDIKTVMEA